MKIVFTLSLVFGSIALFCNLMFGTFVQTARADERLNETGGPALVFPSTQMPEETLLDTTEPVHFSTNDEILQHCPVSDGFAYPVGAPLAEEYWDLQPFGGESHHLGEDWNGGRGKGGNGDLGHPIYSIAHGIVTYAQPVGKRCRYGWGNVVKIVHNAGSAARPVYVESLYAHLDEIHVKKHQIVKRGEIIGTMGNCNGVYWSHLHFELRSEPFKSVGRGYAVNKKGYLNPKKFIEGHRFDRWMPVMSFQAKFGATRYRRSQRP